ncbi:MAG: DoxX family protein [Myxococcota bacterium]
MLKLFSTDRSMVSLVQRVVLAAVMFPHGAQKLLGWFGGYGFDGTMGFLTGQAGLPAPLAVLVILAESLGAVALAFGLLSRVTAAGIASVMIGAVLTSHLSNGFFMNWAGSQAGEGFEYHLLALALAVPLIFKGGGAFAVDRWIAARLGAGRPAATPALAR